MFIRSFFKSRLKCFCNKLGLYEIYFNLRECVRIIVSIVMVRVVRNGVRGELS